MRGGMDKKTLSELSKLMAYILRHDEKQKFKVELDENCYAKINQVIEAIASMDKWNWVKRKHIEEVAAKSFWRKQKRFVIKGDKIKATYRITRKCPSTPKTMLNSAPGSFPFKENEFYVIIAKHSGKCLDVRGISTDKGANIIQYDYWGGDNQKWKLEPVGDGYYRIIAKHSGKCLDVRGISTDNGANIIQWDYWGGDNQKWKLEPVGDGYYRIIAKHSGKCLDVNSKSKNDGAMIQQFRYMAGDNQKWKLELAKTKEISPENAIRWRDKGDSLKKSGRYEEAIAYYDKALEIDQRNPRTWRHKAHALRELKRYEEAIKCLEKALELDPKHFAWRVMGDCFNDLGRYEEAIKCYDKALELKPTYGRAWDNKGWALFNLKRYKEAIRCFDKALKINPTFERALSNKKCAEDALREVERKNPRLCASILSDAGFKVAVWEKLQVTVMNIGEDVAKDIKVILSGPVEVGGVKPIPKLESGKRVKIIIGIKPIEYGDLPLEVGISYKDENNLPFEINDVAYINVAKEDETVSAQPQSIFNIGNIGEILGAGAIKTGDVGMVKSGIGSAEGEFSKCPYCGEVLNLPRTPKYCPYCGEQLR